MNIFLKNFVNKTYKTPGKALDLGAGKFSDVVFLRQLGWDVIGVDKSLGLDLEKPYALKNMPFDLVYSNYLLHKLKNKKQLIETAYNNLKSRGWLFIHTFDKSDKNSSSDIDAKDIEMLLRENKFKNISLNLINFYDDEMGHNHWHKILQAIAQKK